LGVTTRVVLSAISFSSFSKKDAAAITNANPYLRKQTAPVL
jgi:hypothetical protein